jgi:hypothetical protein
VNVSDGRKKGTNRFTKQTQQIKNQPSPEKELGTLYIFIHTQSHPLSMSTSKGTRNFYEATLVIPNFAPPFFTFTFSPSASTIGNSTSSLRSGEILPSNPKRGPSTPTELARCRSIDPVESTDPSLSCVATRVGSIERVGCEGAVGEVAVEAARDVVYDTGEDESPSSSSSSSESCDKAVMGATIDVTGVVRSKYWDDRFLAREGVIELEIAIKLDGGSGSLNRILLVVHDMMTIIAE